MKIFLPQKHKFRSSRQIAQLSFSFLLLVWLSFSSYAVKASEILFVEVQEVNGTYQVILESLLNAPNDLIFKQFIAYDRLPSINASIREATVIGNYQDLIHRIRVVTELCVLIFCKSVTHVQDMEQKDRNEVIATIIPEMSDFSSGKAQWSFKKDQVSKTRLTFSGQFTPSFWVPPLIGTWALKRMLKSEVIETSNGLERMANR
jgi:uncharacterized protein with PQ loop repeat